MKLYKLVAHVPADKVSEFEKKCPNYWLKNAVAIKLYPVKDAEFERTMVLTDDQITTDRYVHETYKAGKNEDGYFVYLMDSHSQEQRKLIEIVESLPDLTERQKQFAYKHCFKSKVLESRGWLWCPETNKVWKENAKCTRGFSKIMRPETNYKKLDVVHGLSYTEYEYFVILTTREGRQIARWFQVFRDLNIRGHVPSMSNWYREVGCEFIYPNGKRVSFERDRNTFCFYYGDYDRWRDDSTLYLKRSSTFQKHLDYAALLCLSVLPVFKRNGFTRKFCADNSIDFMQALTNPQFESYFKSGQYGVCYYLIALQNNKLFGMNNNDWDSMQPEIKTAIKLANRHHVQFKTELAWRDFVDYLKDLIYLHKDIHNPQILFPADGYTRIHEIATKKREEAERLRRERQRVEDMKRREAEDKAKHHWLKKYSGMFSDMDISDGEFEIKPLITRDDFKAEAAQQHHCICTYYGKVDTLLLSIEHNGKKAETAEISLLKDGRLIQCRGKYNNPTQWHAQIVELLSFYMNVFVKRYRKWMHKEMIIDLPVPVSQYNYKIAI